MRSIVAVAVAADVESVGAVEAVPAAVESVAAGS